MYKYKVILGILSLALIFFKTPNVKADQVNSLLPSPAKAYQGKKCVEPSDTMRRNHMDYLMHQRDETVREGIRGKKYSLQQCINCHATTDPKVLASKERSLTPFCSECHSFAAVTIDCFSCHNPTISADKTKEKSLISEITTHINLSGDPNDD